MISRSRYPADSVNEAPVFSRLPVDIEPLDRLRQLRRGDGEVLRGRRELAERRDLLLRGRRRLLGAVRRRRSEEHTSELQSPCNLVCRLLLEKKKKQINERSCQTAYRLRAREAF